MLARRDSIAEAARRFAPSKRYWAVVGNGPNKVAAEEVRIKLSELCYKSIACDVTEDKKHIDLSSEPLILVCAAGLAGSTADDVGKEVAIFRAHKATPIVIADDGDERYPARGRRSRCRPSTPRSGSCCRRWSATCSGTRRRWPSTPRRARCARRARSSSTPSTTSASADAVLGAGAARRSRRPPTSSSTGCATGATTATSRRAPPCASPACCATSRPNGRSRQYQAASGKVGSPAALIDDLLDALTRAIEELTRPIDAIKHQAKTVTVGISRSDEGVLDRPLVQAVLAAGAGRDVLSYRTLKVLADLDPAVAEVTGFTRYGIEGDAIVDRRPRRDLPHIPVAVERNPRLVGTKRRVASRARGARRPRAAATAGP